MTEALAKIFVFILGTIVGSFLNVCIYRLPNELSIIKPSSHCPKCRNPIKWRDNIPLVSYILLRGKCRSCGEKISFRYPLVEFISGALFIFLYLHLGLKVALLKYVIFFCILIVVSFVDIDYHAIPAFLCFTGVAAGLVFALGESLPYLSRGLFNFNAAELPIFKSFKGLIFALGFTYLFKFFGDIGIGIYLSLRKKDSIEGEKESMGLGDVELMGMVGVFLGAGKAVLVFLLAPFFALGYSLLAIIFKKSHVIPYLPYISLAALVIFFWGNRILSFFKVAVM